MFLYNLLFKCCINRTGSLNFTLIEINITGKGMNSLFPVFCPTIRHLHKNAMLQ